MKRYPLAILCILILVVTAAVVLLARQHTMKLGIQAYTLRSYTYEEALEKASSLGIHYMEIYPGQRIGGGIDDKISHKLDAGIRVKILEMAKNHQITLVSYGVITGHDTQEWEQIFGFAKDLHLISINCQAGPETLDYLSQLSKQTGIKVALHNHPGVPGIIKAENPYADPNVAYKTLQGFGANIGVCADTGHWVRTGFDPVEALHLLRGHIIECHFKDLNQGNMLGKDVPWGTGISKAGCQLAELRKQGFDGVVLAEYENNSPELMENLKRCVTYFEGAMKVPISDLIEGKYLPPGFTSDVETQIHNPEALKSGRWPEPRLLFTEEFTNAEVTPENSWKFDQDILENTGAGSLRTKDSFQNYNLSLEFSCADNTRAKIHLKAVPECTNGQDLYVMIAGGVPTKDQETTASILVGDANSPTNQPICITPTRALPVKAGEWNSLVIKAHDSSLIVYLNQELLNTVSLKSIENASVAPATNTVSSLPKPVAKSETNPFLPPRSTQTSAVASTPANWIATPLPSSKSNSVTMMISGCQFTTSTNMPPSPPIQTVTNNSSAPPLVSKAPIEIISDSTPIKIRFIKIE